MLKKWFVVFAALFLLFPSVSLAGSIKDGDPTGTPGTWYLGETPSYVSVSKHPILFVHGLNSSAATWWVENNMYNTAYQNGYETAYIDLYPTHDMWDNGQLLAQKIQEVYHHFGEKVVVVAHSKGGIDTQSALVHYGAYPYVERMITLSTPHRGSQLADLAYSSWAGWLADIVGSKNPATNSLQTGYMEYFRSTTDSHTNVHQTPIYTFGGTEWGGFGSSLYWGGLYLSSYGSNDGAVTVKSSRLPYATELAVGAWNHSTIKEGTSTFSLFKNYLNERTYGIARLQSVTKDEPVKQQAGHYVTGGEYEGKHEEQILVEQGAESITIDWMSDQENTSLTLTSPAGQTLTNFVIDKDQTAVLRGSYHHTMTIENPAAGTWSLEAVSDQEESFLLNTTFDSPLNDLLDTSIANDQFKVKKKEQHLKVKTDMTIEYYKKGKLKETKVKPKKNKDSFKLPKLGEGVYNLTLDIEGTYQNDKFQRTVIKSVYVDDQGKLYYQ